MIPRSFSLPCRRLAVACAAAFLALAAALPLQAAGPETLARADTPRTLDGEGDRTLLVEGPFSLTWQTTGGSFAVKVVAAGQDAPAGSGATVLLGPTEDGKTAAAGATTGRGNGRIKVGGAQNYRVAISASGPWQITVTW